MKKNESEKRTFVCGLAVREAGGEAGKSRTIEGTAIVFNAESEVLDDWGERFREVILPPAVSAEWLNTQDVKLNLLHDRSLTIGRSNKGVGNMTLRVDEKGVHFSIPVNEEISTQVEAAALIKEGVYTGCSFEFYPKDFNTEETTVNGKREVKIIHKSFERLTALTIGMDPAYSQTSVNARELLEREDDEEKKKKKHDGEDEPEEKPEDKKPEGDPKDEPKAEPATEPQGTDGEDDEEKKKKAQEEKERELRLAADMRRRELERMRRECDLLNDFEG